MQPHDNFYGIRKLSTRLPSFKYIGPYRYHLIMHTKDDYCFSRKEWGYDLICCILSQVAGKHQFRVIVYCFMPNHLHLLLEGSEGSNLKEFARIFKQMSAYHYKKTSGLELWQRSYFDKILRRDENTLSVAKYILENPVRWELVRNCMDYPYSGSFMCSPEDLIKEL